MSSQWHQGESDPISDLQNLMSADLRPVPSTLWISVSGAEGIHQGAAKRLARANDALLLAKQKHARATLNVKRCARRSRPLATRLIVLATIRMERAQYEHNLAVHGYDVANGLVQAARAGKPIDLAR